MRGVVSGEGVVVRSFANLYGCTIGDETSVGPFVEIQRGVTVAGRCRIGSHAFVCTGVEIDDERSSDARRASIGSDAVVMGGVGIGAEAMIGAGAVVTHDVEPGQVVVGLPARALRATAGVC